MDAVRFTELSLSPEILKAVADMGFEEATPIQSLSIPLLLQGKDVIGQAQTGTGKTAAFGIPILEKVNAKDRHTQAVVLCPTRELAIQVAEELLRMAKHKKGISILPIYGGQSYERQFSALKKGAQIVIGTPGRVIDHLNRGTLKLEAVRMVVLDEADEMLNMGFREDIEFILAAIPKERQTVFFSATMPKAFMGLTHKFQRDPQLVKVTHGKLAAPDIEQLYFEIKEASKIDTLTRVIDINDIRLALIFCNTKRKVDEVAEHLRTRGYAAEGIHGDMNQAQRERVMNKFRRGAVELLVATDVAARGIDVENIEAVFNYDVPQDEEYYVHRIGRTGRAGKKGVAFTFVAGKDAFKLREIQRYIKARIVRMQVPSAKDVEQVRAQQIFDMAREQMDAPDINNYINMVEFMIGENLTPIEAAGALLKMALQQQSAPAPAPAETPYGWEEGGRAGGMVQLFLNVGKAQKIKVGDIVGAIAGETGISGDEIGNIELRDTFTLVDVAADQADRVIDVMKKRNIKGNRINIRRANK